MALGAQLALCDLSPKGNQPVRTYLIQRRPKWRGKFIANSS